MLEASSIDTPPDALPGGVFHETVKLEIEQ
jgi:hypothetical protein